MSKAELIEAFSSNFITLLLANLREKTLMAIFNVGCSIKPPSSKEEFIVITLILLWMKNKSEKGLRWLAGQYAIEGYESMSKAELIDKILSYRANHNMDKEKPEDWYDYDEESDEDESCSSYSEEESDDTGILISRYESDEESNESWSSDEMNFQDTFRQ